MRIWLMTMFLYAYTAAIHLLMFAEWAIKGETKRDPFPWRMP